MSVPEGFIQGGKAMERWLEPLVDGWSTPYIGAAARTEFEFRPLGGQYVFELALTPQVIAEHIERLQLLVGSTYWVRQN